jgi:hypothetical protein
MNWMDVFNAFEGDTNAVKIQTHYLEYFPPLQTPGTWMEPTSRGQHQIFENRRPNDGWILLVPRPGPCSESPEQVQILSFSTLESNPEFIWDAGCIRGPRITLLDLNLQRTQKWFGWPKNPWKVATYHPRIWEKSVVHEASCSIFRSICRLTFKRYIWTLHSRSNCFIASLFLWIIHFLPANLTGECATLLLWYNAGLSQSPFTPNTVWSSKYILYAWLGIFQGSRLSVHGIHWRKLNIQVQLRSVLEYFRFKHSMCKKFTFDILQIPQTSNIWVLKNIHHQWVTSGHSHLEPTWNDIWVKSPSIKMRNIYRFGTSIKLCI